MEKPRRVRMIGIKWSWHSQGQGKHTRSIGLQADQNILDQLKIFGKITTFSSVSSLDVDARYDKEEVLNYIKWLGQALPKRPQLVPKERRVFDVSAAYHNKYQNLIVFTCRDWGLAERVLGNFGKLTKEYNGLTSKLDAYRTFDIDEIVKYMKSFGSPEEKKVPDNLTKLQTLSDIGVDEAKHYLCWRCVVRTCIFRYCRLLRNGTCPFVKPNTT